MQIGVTMDIDYEKLGLRVLEKRTKLGLTQAALAEKANLSTNHIVNIEKGKSTRVGFGTLMKVADALGVTCEYLVRDDYENSNHAISIEILNALKKCDPKESEVVLAVVEAMCNEFTKG